MSFQLPPIQKQVNIFTGVTVSIFLSIALIGMVVLGGVYTHPEEARIAKAASLVCPFSDGDGGTPGIQVTGNVTIDDVDDGGGAVGDFYDCTASLVEIKSGVTVTLGSNITTGGIAEIHFGDLTIENGAVISATGQGCSTAGTFANSSNICGSGAGAATLVNNTGGGGGHGGEGGSTPNGASGGLTYGSATAPVLFGGSGQKFSGTAGFGGGVVRLDIAGTFTHDGTITANGNNGTGTNSGGGAGGSVYVTTAVLDGTTGVFESSGGNANGTAGGGGGGRIAITCMGGTQCTEGANTLTSASFDVDGGTSTAENGEKGTVYVFNTTTSRVEIFHGFTFTDTDYAVSTWISDVSATNQYCDRTLTSGAVPSVTADSIDFGGALACTPSITSLSLTAPNITLEDASSLSVNGGLNIDASNGPTVGTGVSLASTQVSADIVMPIPAGVDQAWTDLQVSTAAQGFFDIGSNAFAVDLLGTTEIAANVDWEQLTNFSLSATSSMDASALGCSSTGTFDDGTNTCVSGAASATINNNIPGGGGHGGAGGRLSNGGAGGLTYDSATEPVLFGGSGHRFSGTAGAGGGLIRLTVSDTATLDGQMSVDGISGSGSNVGGGAGGSVYIVTDVLDGSGLAISGNGGAALGTAGGGGGGRIAITCASGDQCPGGANALTSASAIVDLGANAGAGTHTAAGKGTVYVFNTTTSRVEIFHGFTFDDTDYAVSTWISDASATNQYCDRTLTSGAVPSVSADTIDFDGTLSCTPTITSFTLTAPDIILEDSSSLSVNGELNIDASNGPTVGTGVSLASTQVSADIVMPIPAGVDQAWTDLQVSTAAEGFFDIGSNAFAVDLLGTTEIAANIIWESVTDLNIASTAQINVSGIGCASAGQFDDGTNTCVSGAGGATLSNFTGGGGGHGGAGGGTPNGAVGGSAYDSETDPTLFGGAGNRFSGTPGKGGGVARIMASGTLTFDGSVTADSVIGSGSNVGGGAGGTVYLQAVELDGTSGTVSAVGTNAVGTAGGGGGGRIAIYYAQLVSALDIDPDLDTLNGDGASVLTAGGTGSSVNGATGTVVIQQVLAMTDAVTEDADANGQIDQISVSFTSDLDASTVSGADFTVTSPAYTVASASETSPGVVTIILNESGSSDTEETPTVTIVGSIDDVGNTTTATSGTILSTDGAAPALLTRETADMDADGQIDAITLTYSEALDDATIGAGAGGIDVSGFSGESLDTGTTADDAVLRVAFTESGVADTDATPTVLYTPGTLADVLGNTVAASGPTASEDVAAPVVVARVPSAGATEVSVSGNFTITFSEPMDEASVEAGFDLSPVAGSLMFTWDGTSEVVTVNPAQSLDAETLYTVSIADTAQSAAIGDSDLANTLWTFTTGRSGGGSSNTPPSTGGGNVTPTVRLTSPNGSEVIDTQLPFTISWSSTGNVPLVTIEYSVDSGQTWIQAFVGIPNNGVVSWDVPDISSSSVLMRIIGTDGAVVITMDGSDQGFSLQGPQTEEENEDVDESEEEDQTDQVIDDDEDPAAAGIPEGDPGSRTNPGSSLIPGTYVRTVSDTTVYYITPELNREPVLDSRTFFTVEDSFGVVTYVTDEVIQTAQHTAPVLPKPGSILITFWSDAGVYVIEENPNDPLRHVLRHIDTEEIAESLAGTNWREYVVDYNTAFKALFIEGPAMRLDEHIDRSLLVRRDVLSERAGLIKIERNKTVFQRVREAIRRIVQ